MSQTPERQIASDFVYAVSAWDGRSPEFMQCQVGKLASLIEDETLKLRTELAAATAANQRLEKERDAARMQRNQKQTEIKSLQGRLDQLKGLR